jgi:hypothetical protein
MFVTITNTVMAQPVTSGGFSGSIPVMIESTVTYTITAYNYFTGQQASYSITVTVTPNVYQLFPLGTVLMWAGPIANVPTSAGWVLCDGNSGNPINGQTIPDLRDRFAIGAGGSVSADTNASGVPDTHTHSTAISPGTLNPSGSDGAHKHNTTFKYTSAMCSGSTAYAGLLYINGVGSGKWTGSVTQSTNSVNNAGAHGHTVPAASTSFNSGTQIVDGSLPQGGMKPAWYSLAYIIKVF